MSQPHPDPDSSNPPRSVDDPWPDSTDTVEEISWKLPVAAAIAGALSVSIFTIYAIVTGPSAEEVSHDEVAARVESLESTPSATFAFVSVAAPRSADATTVPQLDIAFWELVSSTATVSMQNQLGLPDLTVPDVAYVTVAFPPDASAAGSNLLAYVVESSALEVAALELLPELPAEISDFRIDIGDGVAIVIDSLQIADDGGYVEWRVEGGLTARLDVIVTFVGAGEPGLDGIALVPEYLDDRVLGPSTGTDPAPRLYSFGSQYQLVQSGVPLDTDKVPTAINVEFRIEAVTSVGDAVEIPID